jgi:hypothetical protein
MKQFVLDAKHRELQKQRLRVCEICQRQFKYTNPLHKRCGSLREKTGCSWKARQVYMYTINKADREARPEYHTKRKKKWRNTNPDKQHKIWERFYARHREELLEKQKTNTKKKEYQKEYRNGKHGKKVRSEWLKKHPNYYKK